MTKKEKEKRFWELHDLAISRLLDKIDWDIDDWLSKEESEEYWNLHTELFLE